MNASSCWKIVGSGMKGHLCAINHSIDTDFYGLGGGGEVVGGGGRRAGLGERGEKVGGGLGVDPFCKESTITI